MFLVAVDIFDIYSCVFVDLFCTLDCVFNVVIGKLLSVVFLHGERVLKTEYIFTYPYLMRCLPVFCQPMMYL